MDEDQANQSFAEKSVKRTLHAVDVYLLTAPDPTKEKDVNLYLWAVELARDLTMATNPVVWQAAVDALARTIERGPGGLDLNAEQRAEVARWIRSQDPVDEII